MAVTEIAKDRAEKKPKDTVFNILSAVLLIIALVCLLFTVFSVTVLNREERSFAGMSAFIVTSDSMKATDFSAGDLVVVSRVPASTIVEGDIISFTSRNSENYGLIVTHKVRSVSVGADGKRTFTTYGTTTNTDDETQVSESSYIGKYMFSVPGVGYLVNFAKSIPGYLLFILLPFGLLIIFQGRRTVKLYQEYRAAGDEDETAESAEMAKANAELASERDVLTSERDELASERDKLQRELEELRRERERMRAAVAMPAEPEQSQIEHAVQTHADQAQVQAVQQAAQQTQATRNQTQLSEIQTQPAAQFVQPRQPQDHVMQVQPQAAQQAQTQQVNQAQAWATQSVQVDQQASQVQAVPRVAQTQATQQVSSVQQAQVVQQVQARPVMQAAQVQQVQQVSATQAQIQTQAVQAQSAQAQPVVQAVESKYKPVIVLDDRDHEQIHRLGTTKVIGTSFYYDDDDEDDDTPIRGKHAGQYLGRHAKD